MERQASDTGTGGDAGGDEGLPRRASHLAFLAVTETLDAGVAADLLGRVRRICLNCRCVILDLTRTRRIDRRGAQALSALTVELEESDRELRLVVQPDSPAESTLRLLRLLDRLHTFRDLDEARRMRAKPA